jgi:hypothetical protein
MKGQSLSTFICPGYDTVREGMDGKMTQRQRHEEECVLEEVSRLRWYLLFCQTPTIMSRLIRGIQVIVPP